MNKEESYQVRSNPLDYLLLDAICKLQIKTNGAISIVKRVKFHHKVGQKEVQHGIMEPWQKNQATAMPSRAPPRTCDGVWPSSSFSFLLLIGCPWNKSSTIRLRTCIHPFAKYFSTNLSQQCQQKHKPVKTYILDQEIRNLNSHPYTLLNSKNLSQQWTLFIKEAIRYGAI